MSKTFALRKEDVVRKWVVIDASKSPLGRVSTLVASRLIGKYQPQYTPHVDSGDFVVVINADDLKTTGSKEKDKIYYRHTGYPGGIRSKTLKETENTTAVEKAVYGMLAPNKLRSERMKRLKVYGGSEHAHNAQKPTEIGVNS